VRVGEFKVGGEPMGGECMPSGTTVRGTTRRALRGAGPLRAEGEGVPKSKWTAAAGDGGALYVTEVTVLVLCRWLLMPLALIIFSMFSLQVLWARERL